MKSRRRCIKPEIPSTPPAPYQWFQNQSHLIETLQSLEMEGAIEPHRDILQKMKLNEAMRLNDALASYIRVRNNFSDWGRKRQAECCDMVNEAFKMIQARLDRKPCPNTITASA